MDEFFKELSERKVSFIIYKVQVLDHGLSVKKIINKPLHEVFNEVDGLTKDELNKMFEPVDNALDYCTRKLFERTSEVKDEFKRNKEINT